MIGKIYVFNEGINKPALLITIIKSREIRSLRWFFWYMFQCKFAKATQVVLCESNCTSVPLNHPHKTPKIVCTPKVTYFS